jgi:predicted transcriptional regulator
MAITIQLAPEVQHKLEVLAQQKGEDIERVANNLIRDAIQHIADNKTPMIQAGNEATISTMEECAPQTVRDEYQTLIAKKLHRTITPTESARLETVRDQINQIDRQSTSWSEWERRAQSVEQKLTDLRQQLEALPDA